MKKKINQNQFIPKDFAFHDDRLHEKNNAFHVETWYYDAIFDNNYSIVVLINVIHLGCLTRIIHSLFFYHKNILIKHIKKKSTKKHFHGSEDTPLLMMNNKEILSGNIDANTKEWIFRVCLGDEHNFIDLQFTKKCIAWKGKTYLGHWLVIPHFNVKGILVIDKKIISVSGSGYHDHNIYPFYAPLTTKGYHFGKISLNQLIIIWARIQKNKKKNQTLVVFNNNDCYESIHEDDICFTIKKQQKDHGKFIPTNWQLLVTSKTLELNINSFSLNHHYIHVPTVHYWRHHVKNIGQITVNNKTEKIDTIEISEYLDFF
ncbi:MAG: hypothetical protein R6V50_06470 [Thermoplasmatota archaeon]